MLDFTKLWDLQYLFGPIPTEMTRSDLIFFWGGAALVVIALVVKALAYKAPKKSPQKYLLNKYFAPLITVGILVLLWAGARIQNIPWIQTRFVVLVLWLGWIVWIGFVLNYQRKSFKRHIEEWKEAEQKSKYLP